MQEILRSIEEHPKDKSKWKACLGLIQEMPQASLKAESLAKLAALVTPTSKMRGLEFILVAFRMSSENEQVLNALSEVLAHLDLSDIAEELEKWNAVLSKRREELGQSNSLFEDPMVTTIAKLEVTQRVVPEENENFSADANVTRINWISEVNAESTPEEVLTPLAVTLSEPIQVALSLPEKAVSSESDLQEHLLTSQSFSAQPFTIARSDTYTGRPRNRAYEIYRHFLKESGITGGALESAEEFQDSLVGFIHFLHYLKVAKRIERKQFEKCATVVGDYLQERAEEFKAQLRFAELIEPLL